ncbi:hypothetical protein M105_2045 [Bacteroides fragilis str. 1009-4-F |nr:hypothetical protein M105_2045 [Bacteroides fragilis str. 1009-4-F \
MNRKKKRRKAGLFCPESRVLSGEEPGFCRKEAGIHSKRRVHLLRKK